MLTALRDDALRGNDRGGFSLRVGLPWIRSLPLSSLVDLVVRIDDVEQPVRVRLGGRKVAASALASESGWWFVQDRLVLVGSRRLTDGAHDIDVSFSLVVPYLQAGPDGPLRLPFRVSRALTVDAASAHPTVARDVA